MRCPKFNPLAFVIGFVLSCIVSCSVSHGQALDPDRIIGAHDKNYNIGRVFDLPQGEQALYLTIVTHDSVQENSRDAQVLSWFDRDPRLNRIKKQSNFNHYWEHHPHYATEQGKGGMGSGFGVGFPTVSMQRPNGEVLFFAAAVGHDGRPGKLPRTAAELGDMMYAALDSQLQPQQFQSHSSSPATYSGLIDEYPCPPNGPCYPDQTPPNHPGPPLPEFVPFANPLLQLVKDYLPAAMMLGLIALVLVVFLAQRNSQGRGRDSNYFD